MISAKILHLGDFHYPENYKAELIDLKDKCFPKGIPVAISQSPLRSVLKKLSCFCEDDIDIMFFCGDLTTMGDIDDYGKCALQIIRTMSLDKSKWSLRNIHVVPGNHDIDRDSINDQDILSKFNCLESTWSEFDVPIFTKNGTKFTTFEENGTPIMALFSLNSCIGCGEKRIVNSIFQKAYESILDDIKSKKLDLKSFYEVLDAPAFLATDINECTDNIKKLPVNCLPAIVSHHNLLPQIIPRVDLYSNIINAGQLRGRLEACGRPVLYLHGHIHSQEVEVVRDAKINGEKVILISAPQITEGFNVIKIDYNNNKHPIGCTIDLYKLTPTCEVEISSTVKISFVKPEMFKFHASTKATHVLPYIDKPEELFNDLFNKIKDKLRQISRTILAEILIELEWFGLISIENVKHPNKHWRIKRIVG